MGALQRGPGAFGPTNNWPVFSYLKEKLVNGYFQKFSTGMCINRLSLFTECYITQRFLSVPNPRVAYRQEIACRTLVVGRRLPNLAHPKILAWRPHGLKQRKISAGFVKVDYTTRYLAFNHYFAFTLSLSVGLCRLACP